jgi:hypothetical protein
MDKNITPQAWRTVTDGSWENNFKELIKLKVAFSGINYMRIYLPYAVIHKPNSMYSTDKLEFIKLDSTASHELYSIMTLSIKEEFHKKVCAIELTFPGEYKEQLIKRLPNNYYKWNNKEITIKKLIATYDVDEIKKQAEELVMECKRFHFMYCV